MMTGAINIFCVPTPILSDAAAGTGAIIVAGVVLTNELGQPITDELGQPITPDPQ